MGDWKVIIEFDHPYSVEVGQGGNRLHMTIPFLDRGSAESAVREMRIRVEQENPVVQGSLVAGEIEDQR